MNQANNEEMKMKFNELPIEVQHTALETLKTLIISFGTSEEEPAKKLALVVKEAFISLYS